MGSVKKWAVGLPLLILFLTASVPHLYGQTADVIKASGGTGLSIDSVATQGFSPLDGPTIRETASGQLAQGGTIVLTLPSGFVWNDAMTSGDITITITPTGAANTKLAVSFSSITAQEATFTVDTESQTQGNGQGPGRVEIQGLELRPSTTDVPTTGQISNTGTTGPDVNYGDLSTAVGAISQVRVETASDGSGQVVPSQDIFAGESITVYSIARDVGDNFIENIALDSEGDWSVINSTGDVQQTASSADLKSATFSSQQTGTAEIQASYSGTTSTPSGTITVLPRSADEMIINTQPSGSATAGSAFATQPVIFLQDQFGNKVTTDNSTQVTASINSGDGSLSGTLTQTASGGEITFTDLYATIADTITLRFESSGMTSKISNQVIVDPTAASDLSFAQQPTNTAQGGTITPAVTLQLLDEYGNKVQTSGTTVTIDNEPFLDGSSTLSGTTDADGIATFGNLNLTASATLGEAQLTSQFSGISSPVLSNTFLIISADALARYEITAPDGTDIGQQQAGTPFDIQITARDGNGDIKTDFTGTVEVMADATILLQGSEVSSFTTDNFQSGVLDTAITLTSSGSTRIYADQSQDISGQSNSFSVTPSATIGLSASTITADPTSITADGTSTSTITVQLKDEYGNNLTSGGETVELSTTAGTFPGGGTTTTATDQGDGTYTAVLTSSTTAGVTATITGTVNSQNLSDDATVNFEAGEVTSFAISLPQSGGTPATQTAGVPFDIDVQAVDGQGNVVPTFDGSVTFTTNSVLNAGGTASFANGELLNHTIELTKADSNATLTVTADDLFEVSGTSSSFIIIANSPDASTSQLTASPDVLQNATASEAVITIILRDQYQNRVYQQTPVSLSLEQLELNGSPSSGSPDASLANGSNIPFSASQGLYRDTLIATNTVELVEISATFGSSPTHINQTATVDIVVPNTWEGDATGPGTVATDWTNAENWSQGTVPGSEDFVVIPNVTDLPVLDLNISVGSFEVQAGANVTLYGGNAITVSGNTTIDGTLNIEDNTEITVGGNFVGSGSFTAGASTSIDIAGDISLGTFLARTTNSQITLNGSTPQTISTTDFLAQNLNIKNSVNADASNDLIDTAVLTIDTDQTFELNTGANDTLDVGQKIQGGGTLLINDNALVLGGNTDLTNIDASQGTVIFGVRLGQDPTAANLSQQQILNLSQMKNTVINNDHGVRTFEDIIVDGTLTLENGNLIINSGKSLIAPNQVYNNGTLQIRRAISGQSGWRMMSAPINTSFSDLFDELTVQGITGSDYPTRQPNLLYYNETISGTDNQRWRAPADISNTVQGSNPDSLGRGYFFYVFGDVSGDSDYNDSIPVTLNISGQEYQYSSNSFNFSSVTYTAEADTGWNLVGNPWAASLDWDASGWTKTNMDNVIYVWDTSTNTYKTWNGIDGSLRNGLIQPFQAFWVKANGDGTPTLSVDKSVKTTGGTFKGKEGKRPASIAFLLEADTLQQSTHITLSPDGKTGKDKRDAFRLLPFETDTYLELFTTLENGTELAINNLSRSFGKEITIPLHLGGFKDGEPINGEYTLSWPNVGEVPDAWTIILEDHQTGKKIDLRKNSFYSFDFAQAKSKAPIQNSMESFQLVNAPVPGKARAGNDARFSISINPGADAEGLPDEYALRNNYPNPFMDYTNVVFDTPIEGHVQITIYDILGRKVETVVDKNLPADFHKVEWNPQSLASGVYICVMRAGDKQFTKKLTFIK
ncbi:T9SS type A sorting domain-containing protein [Aliifodinibius sp. S!AR15-10]|uniref:invasin domain 3-containing protein n=1 Tax=Aliifodinibius sp. S!AR15-10 TaxID=2950437 RepID=UPI00285C5583|nr:invasin domain 3-containing protein [Aliifodinibius sp. S!AR15-10]MDR8390850.1 T9SS type A sorting domain-containing protein [Aliifodinibius sp. S!AR15-10]